MEAMQYMVWRHVIMFILTHKVTPTCVSHIGNRENSPFCIFLKIRIEDIGLVYKWQASCLASCSKNKY